MSVTLKQLEALVWVADLGSFKQAADRLNTTQPNISARIAAVEGLVGAQLFDRQGPRVDVTPRGRDLVDQARDVLRARDMFLTTANETALTQGSLRLGVTEMIVHTWLRQFVVALKDTFPHVTVELTVDMAAELDRLLAGRQLDLAFMNGPFQYEAEGVPLGRYPLVWVAAPMLGLSGVILQDDLARHPILTHARGTWPYQAVASHFQKAKARLVPSSNLAVCLQMALDGMGVAALPLAMVQADLDQGALVALQYDWVPNAMEFQARFDGNKAPHLVRKAAALAQKVSKPLA